MECAGELPGLTASDYDVDIIIAPKLAHHFIQGGLIHSGGHFPFDTGAGFGICHQLAQRPATHFLDALAQFRLGVVISHKCIHMLWYDYQKAIGSPISFRTHDRLQALAQGAGQLRRAA